MLTESTGVSETTPLHVNTSNQTRTLHADALITTLTSSAPRVLSSATIDSTITATTFASSSNTLNHVPSANGLDDPCGDSTSRLQQEVDHVRKQAIKSKIKTTATLSILLLSLTLCFLTLMQYLMSTFRVLHNPGENDTIISSEEMRNRGIDLPTGPKHKSDKELFDEFGRYIIEDYDALPPFSDFLPVSQRLIVVIPTWLLIPADSALVIMFFCRFREWLGYMVNLSGPFTLIEDRESHLLA